MTGNAAFTKDWRLTHPGGPTGGKGAPARRPAVHRHLLSPTIPGQEALRPHHVSRNSFCLNAMGEGL